MKAGTLIKFTLGLGSLAYSAWQLPQLMDKMQGKGGAGAGGAAALLGAISGQPGQPANPMLSLLGGAPPSQGAKPASAPLQPATPDDLVVFSAGAKALTPEQRAKLLKDAAIKAPLKPGAAAPAPAKKKPGEKVSSVRKPAGAGAKPGDDPLAGVDEQALVDITRQLQDELAKSKKP